MDFISGLTLGSIILIMGGVLFVVIHLVWYIRPSKIKNEDELRAILKNGQPTIIELYSNL